MRNEELNSRQQFQIPNSKFLIEVLAGETVPINENSIAQLVGLDSAGNEIYEGDLLETHGGELVADMSLCAAIELYRLKETKS